MIALASDCLLFRRATGESVPLSAEMIAVELTGDEADADGLDPEFVNQAAKAVFHFFKEELGRKTVTVSEFAEALETVLRGFGLRPRAGDATATSESAKDLDLCRLATESGQGCELFFFTRLRAEVREHMRQAAPLVRFRGLRGCVKQLTGARRWSPRCRRLEGRIVEYLRECLVAEAGWRECSLVVE